MAKNEKHSEIKWAIRIGKNPQTRYFALSADYKGPQLYDLRNDALASRGSLGVAVKVLVKEI